MKKPELFHKSVNILVDAYFNDTLEHGNQCGCAVGNLVAGAMGIKLVKKDGQVMPEYFEDSSQINFDETLSNNGLWYDIIDEPYVKYIDSDLIEKINQQVELLQYSIPEIRQIEKSFEGAKTGKNADDYMFNGLMAVVDCLIEIHEGNEEEKLVAKKQFERVCN